MKLDKGNTRFCAIMGLLREVVERLEVAADRSQLAKSKYRAFEINVTINEEFVYLPG